MSTTLPDPPPPAAPATSAAKTSGLAIASLVFGILGFCLPVVGGLTGLVLGLVGLGKIKKSAGGLTGRGLAVAGIVVSAASVLVHLAVAALIAITIPAVNQALEAAKATATTNNLKQLCTAAQMYATDNKDRLPPAATWPQALRPYGIADVVMSDPGRVQDGRAFAMNAQVGGVRQSAIAQPGRTVLFFECKPGSPPSGGRELMPDQPRYAGRYFVGFCDGHVERVPPDGLDTLLWNGQDGPRQGTSSAVRL